MEERRGSVNMLGVGAVRRFDGTLPAWMGKAESQWICWAYAIWQLVRKNPGVLFLLSYIPFTIRKSLGWVKYRATLVPPNNTDVPRAMDPVDGDIHFSDTEACKHARIEILQRGAEWPPEWRAVKYNGWVYITTRSALHELAVLMRKCNDGDAHKVAIVEESAWSLVGEELDIHDAYEKILCRDYFIGSDDDVQAIPSVVRFADLRSKLWGIASTLPTLVQAFNCNRASLLLSFIIFTCDVLRHYINIVYDFIFERVRVWVQRHVFRKHSWMYQITSQLFSPRWLYTDYEKMYAYVVKREEDVKLKHGCKLRSLRDVSVYDQGEYDPKTVVMEIWNRTGICKEMPIGGIYGVATLNVDIFVS